MEGLYMSENYTTETDYIYEPVNQFQNVFKDLHHQNSTEYIENLIEKSQVNVSENRETVKQIRKLETESKSQAAQIKKQSNLKGFLIFLSIASVIAAAFSIYQITSVASEILYILIIALGIILLVLFIFLIVKKINPKIKELKDLKNKIDLKISALMKTAWSQMSPLNSLFTYGMSAELFHKTIPQINLDKMFDSKRLDYLTTKFGLDTKSNKNHSTLFVQSGEITGNPFYISKDLVHVLGTKTYTGSITITWTTSTTVNGKRVTQHHSQVLTASLDKPCPYYSEQPYLVYGNEAAPNLSFHRLDSDAENLSQKKIDRLVNKDIKKLEKLSEKSTVKGQNYTVMSNSEFEVLFGATDRDNEVQFRLLFTPLAQKQLLDLMKEKVIGFGDDFDFVKQKMINYIYPEHLSKLKLDIKPDFFAGYDVDAIKENFISYNDSYLRHIYFTFAPLLAIPLYQQQKPHEYIYKDLYDSYVSFYEHEKVVNMMNATEFKHPLSQTPNILKTSVVKSDKACDTVKVTAYGYQTERHIEYITKFGGDGRSHRVPVEWIEYIPVSKDTTVDINVIEETKEESYADRFKNMFEGLNKKEVSKENLYAINNFIALITKK